MPRRGNYNKHTVLQHIFDNKIATGCSIGDDIDFTLTEVNDAILATGGTNQGTAMLQCSSSPFEGQRKACFYRFFLFQPLC